MGNRLRKTQRSFAKSERFYRLLLQTIWHVCRGFLEHPSAFTLVGVDVFFGVFGEYGFVLVDLTGCFAVFCPVYDPIREAGRVVVKVVVADGCDCGFVGGFSNLPCGVGQWFGIRWDAVAD